MAPPRPFELHRCPEPESANNNPLKRTGDGAAGDLTIVRPAAAAPAQAVGSIAPPSLARTRESSEYGQRQLAGIGSPAISASRMANAATSASRRLQLGFDPARRSAAPRQEIKTTIPPA
jgi:hypothetical protein